MTRQAAPARPAAPPRATRPGRPCGAGRRCAARSWRARPGTPSSSSSRRLEHPLGRAEVPQQRAAARRADALELVEHRLARRRVAPLAVEGDREAVRLVADPLQELQPRRVLREQDRLGAARDEDLLDPLGERDRPRRAAGRARASPRARRRAGPCRRRSRRGSGSRRTTRRTPPSRAGREPREAPRARPRAIAAKSSWPAEAPHRELPVVRLLRRRRPRRRPSSRRSPGPGCSRCRSTRSGSAATRGSAPRAAPRAPRRGASRFVSATKRLGLRARARRSAARAPAAAASRRAPGARTSTCEPRRSERNASSADVSPTPRGTRICGGIDGADAVVLEAEPLEHLVELRARRRSRGGTSSGRPSARRAAGRPAPPRARPTTAMPDHVDRPDRRALDRLPLRRAARPRAAGSGSAPRPRTAPRPPPRASARSSRLRIGRSSPERNSITPSISSR